LDEEKSKHADLAHSFAQFADGCKRQAMATNPNNLDVRNIFAGSHTTLEWISARRTEEQ
jgi:hypothetical protein